MHIASFITIIEKHMVTWPEGREKELSLFLKGYINGLLNAHAINKWQHHNLNMTYCDALNKGILQSHDS